MQLKIYQENALEQLDRYLEALKDARKEIVELKEFYIAKGKSIPEEIKDYPRSAWNSLKKQNVLPGIPKDGNLTIPDHISRTATSGEPIPHVCLKVPTGGGKTLLGVAALARIKRDTGFVLWIVPTKAIYEQTIKAFRTREHPYRQWLEWTSGGKVKLLQKGDPFTKLDIESHLCVMMLMLSAANRQKNKDFLKIFQDSSGYGSFFPEEDDYAKQKELSERHPDLEKTDSGYVTHSLSNTLKLIRPTVILDEAHKAYGRNDAANKEFVQSVNRLNPRFVLELSATPKIEISNILVNISGLELKDEEMIKLPIEIHSFDNFDWKYTLAETQGKLAELDADARKLQARKNRYVRPIALVRVQRTGKDQREQGNIHSEDVRDYLIRNLFVPESEIRIQSSEQKELAGEDLLSEASPVRWIITKDALKEGWDCSFAYVLALLDNTTAVTAITQMVGRVMRQPHARRIEESNRLNCCYIYCYNKNVGDAAESVKVGLEREGLTGLGDSVHVYGEKDEQKPTTIKRRKQYKQLKIFLPYVLHKEGGAWRLIDYDRDILSAVDWNKIDGGDAVDLNDQDSIQANMIAVDIQGQSEVSKQDLNIEGRLNLDYFVRRLVDMVPNPWQAARVAESFIQKNRRKNHGNSKLFINQIYLSEVLRGGVKQKIDHMAKSVFRDKVRQNEIEFCLETNEQLNYEMNKPFDIFAPQDSPLRDKNGVEIQHSLFEPVYTSSFNTLEKNFALYLDESKAIYWWHRIAMQQSYYLQGWRRHRVYPDFVVCRKNDDTLLILETKGVHLQGNEDTRYKQELLEILEKTYQSAIDGGMMHIRETADPTAQRRPIRLRMLFQDRWEEQINGLISDSP